LGIPPRVDVCGPKDLGMLAEEVVFKPGSAPLWLRAGASGEHPAGGPGYELDKLRANKTQQGGKKTLEDKKGLEDTSMLGPPVEPRRTGSGRWKDLPARVYELRHREATEIVGRAVRGAKAVVGPGAFEAEPRPMSPCTSWDAYAPSCGLDFVAECVGSESAEMRGRGRRKSRPPPSKKFSPANAVRQPVPDDGGASAADINSANFVPAATAAEALKLARQRDSEFGWTEDDRPHSPCSSEDDRPWWQACSPRNSRSPLRWIWEAPLMQPIVRSLSPRSRPQRDQRSPNARGPRGSPRHNVQRQNSPSWAPADRQPAGLPARFGGHVLTSSGSFWAPAGSEGKLSGQPGAANRATSPLGALSPGAARCNSPIQHGGDPGPGFHIAYDGDSLGGLAGLAEEHPAQKAVPSSNFKIFPAASFLGAPVGPSLSAPPAAALSSPPRSPRLPSVMPRRENSNMMSPESFHVQPTNLSRHQHTVV